MSLRSRNKNIYATYLNAQGVGLSWIGGLIGPALIVIGLTPLNWGALSMGIGLSVLALFCIQEGFRMKSRSKSDFVIMSIVPLVLLLLGLCLSAIFFWANL